MVLDKEIVMKREKIRKIVYIAICLIVWRGLFEGYKAWLMPMFGQQIPQLLVIMVSSIVVPYGICILPFYMLLQRVERVEIQGTIDISIGDFFRLFIIQSGLSMLVMVGMNLVMMLIMPIQENPLASQMDTYPLFYAFLLLIFNPIAEEWVFRKLILERLLPLGEKTAIIWSSLLFALPHVLSQGFSAIFYTFILALVWSFVMVKTGKLIYPIILHALSNIWGMYMPSLLLEGGGQVAFFLIWMILVPVAAIVLVVKNQRTGLLKLGS